MVGLGEGEGAEALGPGHRRQPALLLLLGAEHGDRAHRQPRLDAEEGAQAAVAAVELHVHQPGGDCAHRRAAVALDAVADQPQLAEPPVERQRHLGALPVVGDHRQDLAVHEAPAALEVVDLLLTELVADEEVVGAERLADVGGRGRGGSARLGRGRHARRLLSARWVQPVVES